MCDFVMLLFVYNATFIFLWKVFRSSPGASFITAILSSLIGLFGITLLAFIKKLNEEKIEQINKEEEERKKIREEYQRIHKYKKKKELLLKSGYLEPHSIELAIEPEEYELELTFHSNSSMFEGVHFDYVNGDKPAIDYVSDPKGQNFGHMVDEKKIK